MRGRATLDVWGYETRPVGRLIHFGVDVEDRRCSLWVKSCALFNSDDVYWSITWLKDEVHPNKP